MTNPIPIQLKQKPTIPNRATALNDAISQEVRHRWPMQRAEEICAIAYVLRGWSLAIDKTLTEDQRAFVEREAKHFAHRAFSARAEPEDQAVNAEGETVDRVQAPGD